MWKIGDKVKIPLTKSHSSPYNTSHHIINSLEQGFMYVVGINSDCLVLSFFKNTGHGDHFLFSEVHAYNEITITLENYEIF